jgi:hypothetical protein
MRIKSEQDILNIEVRAKIIKEILGPENQKRKDEAFKRYRCYKDKTKDYVLQMLYLQFDAETVNEMRYAMSNIAFVRKVIDKLARVYKYGIDREAIGDEQTTEAIQKCTKELDVDQSFKKANRFLKLQKNTVQYIVPCDVYRLGDSAKKTIKTSVLPPFLYDAIELEGNREKAACFILSDYANRDLTYFSGFSATGLALKPGTDGRSQFGNEPNAYPVTKYSDGIDQTIADDPRDQRRFKGFVFWSDSFHFTCNEKGEIISGEEIDNPIGTIPFVNYAEDQDGAFWAIGGDDLADGTISLNSMITNINHIGITQGYGQLVGVGKNLPRNLKVGPNKVVLLEQQEGEPTPSLDYKTASPPLDQLRSLVEMYVALLLTTNNLSTSGVSSNLNGGQAFASGIAMMIDKAESMEDIEDQRQIFIDNEPRYWDIVAKWHRMLKAGGELVSELEDVDFAEDFTLNLTFGQPSPIQSEKEELEVLKMKMDMGLMSKLDALREYNPGLTDDELVEKLERMIEEGLSKKPSAPNPFQSAEENKENEGEGIDAGNVDDSERLGDLS